MKIKREHTLKQRQNIPCLYYSREPLSWGTPGHVVYLYLYKNIMESVAVEWKDVIYPAPVQEEQRSPRPAGRADPVPTTAGVSSGKG